MKKLTLSTLVAFGALLASSFSLADNSKLNTLLTTCATCHGSEGVSINPQWPNIAGQNDKYLADQLRAYRSGQRVNALMSGQAKNLSDTQIDALAKHYSALTPAPAAGGELNQAGAHVRGRCISCHGIEGKPVNAEWPILAGQKAAYLREQLMAFKSGTRKGSLMNVVAAELSDTQIANVAEYFSQQQP
ncbi:MAG: c-type cytochrome [Porticoccaceae bacterium]